MTVSAHCSLRVNGHGADRVEELARFASAKEEEVTAEAQSGRRKAEETPFLSGSPKLAPVPLLSEDVLIDDNDATIVLIFPKSTDVGGTVDPEELIHNPRAACEKIFMRPSNRESFETMKTGLEDLDEKSIPARVYQEAVRSKVLHLLRGTGMKGTTFESIDGDEVFLKLCWPREGEVMKSLAQRYQYKLPFNKQAYKDVQPSGKYPGGVPMKNRLGEEVPAYAEFELEIEHHLMPFREVDRIRIMELRLDEWLNLEEMVTQKIISRFFAAANYQRVLKFHDNWGSLSKILALPDHKAEDDIRDYFGEVVAFFFRWYAFYVRMLVPLAVVGLVCGVRKMKFCTLSLKWQRYIKLSFMCALVIWTSIYNKFFKNRAARSKQKWGMKDYDAITLELSSYNPCLENTWQLWFRKTFTRVFVMVFCLLFAGTIFFMEYREAKKGHHGRGRWTGAMKITVLIKVASFIWNRAAPLLVNMQNHRTQARWNDALTTVLASVKLFVAIFPFVEVAFLQKYAHSTCPVHGATELSNAIYRIYGNHSWPHGLPQPPTWSNSTSGVWPADQKEDLKKLFTGFYYTNTQGHECIYGCYPVECWDDPEAPAPFHKACMTNCMQQLQSALVTFYATHFLTTVCFLVIPIVLTRIKVQSEHRRAQKAAGSEGTYTFMQLQAKCHESASYEYNSWGGSTCEDFLELAIGFMLLVCFGIVLPPMAVFALISAVVEYRLLAYRMTNITCRPMPTGSEGIGKWQSVFEAISLLAVTVNVGLAVFVMHPMRTWDWGHQFLAVLILEHLMLLLHYAILFVIPDEPEDVQHIEDFNVRFRRRFVRSQDPRFSNSERHSMDGVDIGLGSPLP